jgi:hypothetical protein
MGIFDILRVFGDSEDEMAKKAKKEIAVEAVDTASSLAVEFAGRLARAGTDKAAFELVLASLRVEKRLTARDVIDVAHAYGGGKRTASKAAALAAISKRYVELVRFQAKNKVAEKARPF